MAHPIQDVVEGGLSPYLMYVDLTVEPGTVCLNTYGFHDDATQVGARARLVGVMRMDGHYSVYALGNRGTGSRH